MTEGTHASPGGRRSPARLVAVVIALILIAGVGLGGYKVYSKLRGPADYSGTGTGSVTVSIPEGAGGSQIGSILEKSGVVKSSSAYYQAALADSSSSKIQAGTYKVKKQMSAKSALAALADPSNRVEVTVTIPEGFRVGQIVARVAARTSITAKQMEAALDNPATIGLPSFANGNPEGYLFPATYTVEPGESATQLLKQMTAKTLAVMKELQVGSRSQALGMTPEKILTMASILEYEGKRDEDYPKIARVLYNRLDKNMMLQLDSTVSYASKRKGDVWTTDEERNSDSAYNTYKHTGLPPGPIGSAGEKTLNAAMNPAQGNWLFFFAKKDGSTVFNESYSQHLKDCRAEYGQGSCA